MEVAELSTDTFEYGNDTADNTAVTLREPGPEGTPAAPLIAVCTSQPTSVPWSRYLCTHQPGSLGPEGAVVTPLVAAALPLPLSPGPVEGLSPVNPPVGETAQKVIVLPVDTPELVPPSAIEDIFREAPPEVESALEDVGVSTPCALFPSGGIASRGLIPSGRRTGS